VETVFNVGSLKFGKDKLIWYYIVNECDQLSLSCHIQAVGIGNFYTAVISP